MYYNAKKKNLLYLCMENSLYGAFYSIGHNKEINE